jgi:hypothetical protein
MSKLTLKEITDGLKGGALTPRQADKAIKELFHELIIECDWVGEDTPMLEVSELRQKVEEL